MAAYGLGSPPIHVQVLAGLCFFISLSSYSVSTIFHGHVLSHVSIGPCKFSIV